MTLRLLPVWLFLASLIIAPQLWWAPMRDMRVDFIIYPLWVLVLAGRGRLGEVFRLRTVDRLALALYAWTVISALLNGWNDATAAQVFNYTKYLVVLRLTCASIADVDDLRGIGYAFVVIALLIAVEAIQHYHHPEGIGWAGQSFAWIDPSAQTVGLNARVRWVGIFDGPGVFCVVFTVALPFVFRYMAPPLPVLVRLGALGLLAAPIALAAFYTGSRGGILASAATAGMFVISRFRISLSKLAFFGVLGLAVLGLAPSYLTESRDSHGSAQGRVEMWAKGFVMLQDNPAFGVGRGNYARHTGKLVAHNSGLEVMGELGLPGMFFWFGMLYAGFMGVVHRIGQVTDPGEREALVAVMLAMAGYLVSSLFVSLETEIMYFLVGLLAGAGRLSAQPRPFTTRDKLMVAGIALGYALLFKIYVMRYF